MRDCKRLVFYALTLLSILALLSILGMPTLTLAALNNATVTVSISEVSQISVIPTTLTWSSINPGQSGTVKDLIIKNTGSLNVSNIYVYVDTLIDESSRPYNSGDATDYAAGGVIAFRNDTYNKYFFAGRIEWNWTENISNMYQANVDNPAAWGFFKNTSYEYNWLVGNGTDGLCNDSYAQFAIEDDVDNGTTATRTPTTTNINYDSGDEDYGYFSIDRTAISESCVAISADCQKIYVYKYDKRSGFTSCSNSSYIQTENLIPGDTHTLTLNVYIPYGIPNGTLNTSTFTVFAT